MEGFNRQNIGNLILGFKSVEQRKLSRDVLDSTGEIYDLSQPIDLEDSAEYSHFLSERSKNEIVQNALRVVLEETNCQLASIFCVSKDGFLERIGTLGIDKHGSYIEDSWYANEKYFPGEDFVGQALISSEDSGYGKILFTNDFADAIGKDRQAIYLDRLGHLDSAIAIPLDDQTASFGVLLVVNKVNSLYKQYDNSLFTQSDVLHVSHLSVYISTALSNFRRDIKTRILEYLSSMLVHASFLQNADVYTKALSLLVHNPETAFKAGILYIKDSNNHINVVSLVRTGDVSGDIDISPVRVSDGFLGTVLANGTRLILQSAQEHNLERFSNSEWIIKNGFKAIAFFPLFLRNEVLGILSLYTGYNYSFHPDDVSFVQSVTDLLASLVYANTKQDEFEKLNRKPEDNDVVSPQLDAKESSSDIDSTQNHKAVLQALNNWYNKELEDKKELLLFYQNQLSVSQKQISDLMEVFKIQANKTVNIVNPINIEVPKVFLHPNQLKILQAIDAGVCSEAEIAQSVGLSVDLVEYYTQRMVQEGYLHRPTYEGHSLTSQGKVAATNSDLLLPVNKNAPNQTTILAPNSNIGFIQSGDGQVSHFSQNIGQNADDIVKLIDCLRSTAQRFPEVKREEALMHLDDLQNDISQPEKRTPARIKARLVALWAIACTLAVGIAGATDFSNNVLELADKLGVPIEFSQSQSTQQLPPSP